MARKISYLTSEQDGRRAQPFLGNITLSIEGEGREMVPIDWNNKDPLRAEISTPVQRGQ